MIKPIIQQLSNARQGIQDRKNISDNVEKMKNAFDQLGPAMKNQLELLQTMSPTSTTKKEGSEKLLEQKRYFERFLDIITIEYEELITIASGMLHLPNIEKVLYAKDKYFNSLKEMLTPETNYFELLFKLLNIRDVLISQIVKSMLYRKLLLWKDMAIPNEPFVHYQIKMLLNQIELLMSKGQMVPSKQDFKEIEWEVRIDGIWKYQIQQYDEKDNQQDAVPISVLLKLLNNMFEDMLDSLRNYSNLSADPQAMIQVTTNGERVTSLRSQIEILSQENYKLQQNYNELKINMKTTDFDNLKRMNQRIEELEIILARKEREINELMSNSKGSLNLISNLREKLKEVEEENHKFNVQFFPKLRELEGQQLKLMDEFNKLKKDIDTYSSLFKLESQMREKALKDKEYCQNQVDKLVQMLGKEKQKSKELNDVIRQKESIIHKIIEARRESINGIEYLESQIAAKENQIQKEQQKYIELMDKQQITEKKYQDMFEINTHFNKRIYELEKQKKHLLDLLKKNSIEPDPTKFIDDS